MEKTVAQIIQEANLAEQQRGVDLDTLCQDLDINYYDLDHDWAQIDKRFSHVTFDSWTCWDTAVGKNLILFDDEPVVITCQSARKSDVEVFWLGRTNAVKIREFLLSLITFDFDRQCQFIGTETVIPIEGAEIGDSGSARGWHNRQSIYKTG